jgi:hypothetical protein
VKTPEEWMDCFREDEDMHCFEQLVIAVRVEALRHAAEIQREDFPKYVALRITQLADRIEKESK